MKIIISRTDSIGDVVLTIPIAGYLKQKFPTCKIYFLGRTYTKAIIEASRNIDVFVNWDDISKHTKAEQKAILKGLNADWILHVFPNREIAKLAKEAKIPNRVGTSHRVYHWLTCNKKLHFTRKNSELHEAQLNFMLLKPIIGEAIIPEVKDLPYYYGIEPEEHKNDKLPVQIDPDKVNVILHPKSKGSAREWGLENFGKLIELLPGDRFNIYISGTEKDRLKMDDWLSHSDKIIDITGKLSLEEFVKFIARADALVAVSTGPLHIAAALGTKAIGIYPPIRPMHPGRWKPVGDNVKVFVEKKECNDCEKMEECACMKAIKPENVANEIMTMISGS